MRRGWRGRRWWLIGVTAIAALAAPASAPATDYFVNGTTGSNTNNCLAPSGTPPNGPCQTIGGGTGAIAKAQDSDGNRVLLADGNYNENFTLTSGIVLSSSDGDVDPKPVVNGQVTINAVGASIDHLQLTSIASPTLQVTGPATISDNAFSATGLADLGFSVRVQGEPAGAGVVIQRNTFTDGGSGTQFAINREMGSGTVSVLDNLIANFFVGVRVGRGTAPAIRRNTITGGHDGGAGIDILGGFIAEITDNRINSPVGAIESGVRVATVNEGAAAALARNRIVGSFLSGVDGTDTATLTLDSDLIAGAGTGLATIDTMGPLGNVTATNATIFDNTNDIATQGALVTLNSVITGDVAAGGGGTCAISFSRGDIANGTPGDLTNCDDFQTAVNPLVSTDYHLLAGSPMVDAGDTSPSVGPTDFDGDPRALSGAAGCTLAAGRRDIGADEFVPAVGIGCPPTAVPATPTSAPPKKCKKGRKLKKGRCVKKKRKKP